MVEVLSDRNKALFTVLRQFLIVCGAEKCLAGRMRGCKWMQISNGFTAFMRHNWPKCMEPDCGTEPGTHSCTSGRLICCKHAFRFKYYHEHWHNNGGAHCVCMFDGYPPVPRGPKACLVDNHASFSFRSVGTVCDSFVTGEFYVVIRWDDQFEMIIFPEWFFRFNGHYSYISPKSAKRKMQYMRHFQSQIDRRIIYVRSKYRIPLVQHVTGQVIDLAAEPKTETHN